MKKIIFFVFYSLVLFSFFQVNSQTVYNIKKNSGQTINISNNSCKVIFQSSNASFTGTFYQYKIGEDYYITFYSGSSAKRLKIIFGNVDGVGNFTYNTQTGEGSLYILSKDFLYIYDGPNTSSPLMHKYTGVDGYSGLGLYHIFSSSSYLTFRFTSANTSSSNIFLGWSALITCETKPSAPGGTEKNPPAQNFCYNAPEICNLDGYYGNTSDYYTSDLPGNMCEMCDLFNGTMQNNSWVTFTADSTDAVIEIKVGTCSKGIQLAVYSGDDCNNFKLISDIAYTTGNLSYYNAGKTLTLQLPYKNLPKLIPGKTYYIMIDGLAGDVCDYTIKAKKGVTLKVNAGADQSICLGESAQLNATGGNAYRWSPTEGLNNPNIANPLASPTTTTTYTVTATGGTNPNCPLSNTDDVVVKVEGCGCEPPSVVAFINNINEGYAYCSRGGGGETLLLKSEIKGGTNCKTKWVYSWFNGAKYFDGTNFNSATELWSADYTNAKATAKLGLNTFIVKVRCDGSNTCLSSAASSVVVMISKGIYANIFNPANGKDHSLLIRWTEVKGSDGYVLEYSDDLSNWKSLYEGKNPYFHHYLGDFPNKAFYYKMQVYKGSARCDWTSLSIPAYTACDFPNLVINNTGENSIELSLEPEYPVENPAYTTYAIYCPSMKKYLQPDGVFATKDTFLTKENWDKIKLLNLPSDSNLCFYALAKNFNGVVHTEGMENTVCSKVTDKCILPAIKDSLNIFYKLTGEEFDLNLKPEGNSPFSYQWKKDSVILTDSVRNSFVIKSLSPADSGTYFCTIANKCGSKEFQIAILSVGNKPAITGKILYDNKYFTPVNLTKLYLKNKLGDIIDSTSNDNNGYFVFPGLNKGSYNLDYATKKSFKGSDPLDALIINRYYLGKYSFANNFRILAADVTNDKKVNPLDALMINRRYIGLVSKFKVSDWLFENMGEIVLDNKNIEFNQRAICSGDVNGSYPPSAKKSDPTLIVKYKGEIKTDINNIISIPITCSQYVEAGALGLVFEYDKSDIAVLNLFSNIDGMLYNNIDNKIYIAFSAMETPLVLNENDVVINIVAKVLKIADKLSPFKLNEGSIANDWDFNSINYQFLSLPYISPVSVNDDFYVYPDFSDKLSIHYFSDKEQNAVFEIYDILGNIVMKHKLSLSKGNNNFSFSSANLCNALYTCKLITLNGNLINKIIVNK
ncbi:MAG: T9SS type A sorting domain-containing protein [Bacteroidales bacterium]|nr:T9SS type A sorting domain-containing protein [Bacteroidales bacterium]